jgi:hypothetical protein
MSYDQRRGEYGETSDCGVKPAVEFLDAWVKRAEQATR